MDIQVISDLHMDFGSFKFEPAADYLVVAGDFGNSFKYLKKFIMRWHDRYKKIFFVLGNHDYYEEYMLPAEMNLIVWLQKYPRVVWLDNDCYEIEDRLFYGGTMWTNYWDNPIHEMVAQQGMNDFEYIKLDRDVCLTPPAIKERFGLFAKGLTNCQAMYGVPDLVVSHHGPSEMSLTPHFFGDPLNPAYVEPMYKYLHGKTIWIHGHVHTAFDYIDPQMHMTRVICNPLGYRSGDVHGFKHDKTITL